MNCCQKALESCINMGLCCLGVDEKIQEVSKNQTNDFDIMDLGNDTSGSSGSSEEFGTPKVMLSKEVQFLPRTQEIKEGNTENDK